MRFDFANAEAFTPSLDTLLDVGNHLVTIKSASAGKNKNGNLELVVEASNPNGGRTDWIYYGSEFGQSKVAGLCVATGVRVPTEGDWNDEGVLTQDYCNLFVGKDAGMVVRNEEYNGQQRPKVRGWVHPTQINSDIPADVPSTHTPAVAEDDDIPF